MTDTPIVAYFDAHEAYGIQQQAGWYRVRDTVIRGDGREVVSLIGPFEAEWQALGLGAEPGADSATEFVEPEARDHAETNET